MKKTFILFISLLLITACNNTNKISAVEYNDQIIEEQSKILRLMIDMAGSFDSDPTMTDKMRQDITKQCDSSIKVVSEMAPFSSNTKFRDAAVELFKFYKDISENEYVEMLAILSKEAILEQDLARLNEIEANIAEREAVFDDNFQQAQKVFAKANNMDLYENEMQKEIDNL